MEAFPEDYISHNVPLILLFGIGQEKPSRHQEENERDPLREGGFRIRRDSTNLTSEAAVTLLQAFAKFDSTGGHLHHGVIRSQDGRPGPFKIKTINGRTYALPPRKASPPPHAPPLGPLSSSNTPPASISLHSTISPLTPSSPIYPDGIITPLWITKHQSCLPALFFSFFSLSADPNTSSLRDNQMKTEINSIRNVLSSTNYKTKLVVVLLSELDSGTLFDQEERLISIRKTTSLDAKQLCFLGPPFSETAIYEFVKSVLTSLQPSCIEYYRDLSKHSRRKRNRTSIPPPTAPPTSGTSQTLPVQGWNVRYEFKLGIFSEFRQELEAACRNYESAYETLYSLDLLETISAWSPRFNEMRLLADSIALRILRCLLLTSQPTHAVSFWSKHRRRTQDLVNNKGKGSNNYGWEAWESIWAKSFAQLQAMTDQTELLSVRRQHLLPEKSIPIGERLNPWEALHHEGYWYDLSRKHVLKRRQLALDIPEEDRKPTEQNSSPVGSSTSHLYDTYLALEPHLEFPHMDREGYDYSREILSTLRLAIRRFSVSDQTRFVERLQLNLAEECDNADEWQDARIAMRSAWSISTWRKNGWWSLAKEAASIFMKMALKTNDGGFLLQLCWEIQNKCIPMMPGMAYDFGSCLDLIDTTDGKVKTVLHAQSSLSPVLTSFCFDAAEGNVGEPLRVQLLLISVAHEQSTPIRLSEIDILFEGGQRTLKLLAKSSADCSDKTPIVLQDLQLSESDAPNADESSSGPLRNTISIDDLDMAMHPRQRRAFQMNLTPCEAGELKVSSINIVCETGAFRLTYVNDRQSEADAFWLFTQNSRPRMRRLGRGSDASTIKILPKPPKVNIRLPELKSLYYTNERISLSVIFENGESETADVSVEAKISSPLNHKTSLRWEDESDTNMLGQDNDDEKALKTETIALPTRFVASLDSGCHHHLDLLIDSSEDAVQHELQLLAKYRLQSNTGIELTKALSVHVRIDRPFEANYELLPRASTEPWTGFFDFLALERGITQEFLFVTKLASFVMEPTIIDNVKVLSGSVSSKAVCKISEDQKAPEQNNQETAPHGLRESSFEVTVCSVKTDEGHSIGLDLTVLVQWRRSSEDQSITSTLQVPRYILPVSEPRVLLSRRAGNESLPGLVLLEYTAENPSMHYLNFNLAMETSDEFAFSGPKSTSFSLVPMSRHTVYYRLLSHQVSRWVRVQLGVTDAYFSKALRVSPASDGIKSDGKRGVLVWIE